MDNEEFAKKLANSDLFKKYLANKKSTVTKSDDSTDNKEILPPKSETLGSFFEKMFEGTRYIAKENCTYAVISKGGNETQKRLCNFVSWIEREVTTDDGLETHKVLKICGKHQNGDDLPGIDVSENDFQSMNWIIRKWGVYCILEPHQSVKESLRHCIQVISKNIKSETVFKHIGWRKYGGKWIYLHGSGAVGADNIKVFLEGKAQKYRLPQSERLRDT